MLSGPSFQSYYLAVDRMVSERLKQENHEYLARVNFDEFLNHLAEELAWEELEWE